MTKLEALRMIDAHKNKLVNPVEMLHWTYLRVIIFEVPDQVWDQAFGRALETLSK